MTIESISTFTKEIEKKTGISIINIENIPGSKNLVAKLICDDGRNLLLKVLVTKPELFNSDEVAVYQALGQQPWLKEIVSTGTLSNNCRYILTSYEGEKESTIDNSASSLIKIMDSLFSYPTDGFGPLGSDEDNFSDWHEYLSSYLNTLRSKLNRIENCPQVGKLIEVHNYIQMLVDSNKQELMQVSPSLVLCDANIQNLIAGKDNAYLVDLESIVRADWRLAIGELYNHYYGTETFVKIFTKSKFDFTPRDLRWVRVYAMMAALDILTYLAKLGENINDIKPWGAPYSFFALIEWHRSYIESDRYVVDPVTLLANPLLDDTGSGDKVPNIESTRLTDINEALVRLHEAAPLAGITRVPDITHLDVTCIPAYQTVRPDAEIDDETFTVFSGKGTTVEACKASAIAEAIERFCAEKRNYSEGVEVASYNELAEKNKVVDPRDWGFRKREQFDPDAKHEWVKTTNIINGQSWFVPAESVFYPYKSDVGESWFRYYTTGLAAGNQYLEAVSHGLAEAIERDSAAMNLITKDRVLIDNNSIDHPAARELIDKIEGNSLDLYIRDISTDDIAIPCFSVICDDPNAMDNLYISGGYGCHPNKDVALLTAINECALSRVTTISGAREDILKFEYKREYSYTDFKQQNSYWFDKSVVKSYQKISDYKYANIMDDLSLMANQLSHVGIDKILVANIMDSKIGLPVVKVVVPGIERYSFRMECVGLRARRAYLQKNKSAQVKKTAT